MMTTEPVKWHYLKAEIQRAVNDVRPPESMTETRAEYWKAGARAAIRAINEALASAPAPAASEPVAWMLRRKRDGFIRGCYSHAPSSESLQIAEMEAEEYLPLYAAPLPGGEGRDSWHVTEAMVDAAFDAFVHAPIYPTERDRVRAALDAALGAAPVGGEVGTELIAQLETVEGMLPADYVTGYREAIEHVRKALSAPAAPVAGDELTYQEWCVLAEHFNHAANFTYAIDRRVRDWIERNRVEQSIAAPAPVAEGGE